MAKFTGEKASFSFGGTEYECLQSYNWSGSIQKATSQCSSSSGAVTYQSVGASEDTFTFDVVLEAGSSGQTVISALKRGTSGAFEFHPEDDATNNIEFVATNAIIESSGLAGGPSEHGVLSITIGIDGALTIQAAT